MDEEKDEELDNDMSGKEMIEAQPKGRIAQIIDNIKDTFRRMSTPRLGTHEDNIRKGARPLKVQTTNRSFSDMVTGNTLPKKISKFINDTLHRTIVDKSKRDVENSPTTVTTEGKVTHEGSLQNGDIEKPEGEIVFPGAVNAEPTKQAKDDLAVENISVDTQDISYEEVQEADVDSAGDETSPVEKDIVSKKDLGIEKEFESTPLPDDSFFSSLEEIDEEISGKKEKKDKDENTRDE